MALRGALYLCVVSVFLLAQRALAQSGPVTQRVESGGTAVQVVGSGNTTVVGYTIEQHERILKEQEAKLRKELANAYALERRNTELEAKNARLETDLKKKALSEIQTQLADLRSSYAEKVKQLEQTIEELGVVAGGVDPKTLEEAEAAVGKGDAALADALFAKVEKQNQPAAEKSARAAFGRGQIAEWNFDYRSAYAHYQRAISRVGDNVKYLDAGARMAIRWTELDRSIGWSEQAETILLKAESDPSSRSSVYNNLGSAWQDKGEYDKAIGYFEQALASDLRTYDEAHPTVARDRNNLGGAWQDKGEYDKAIGYYEQALAIFVLKLGNNHPSSKTVRQNLDAARAKKGST